MFDLFRSRAKAVRILLGGLLLLVALSMLTYLIPGGYTAGGGEGDMVVAEIGKDAITVPEVQQVVQANLQNRRLPADMMANYIPQFINSMITDYALAYEAKRLGYRVSDADVAAGIREMMPQLFQNGKFAGKEAYAAVLAQRDLTIPQFESELARQLLITKFRDVALEGTVVTPQEIEREYKRRHDKVRIEYVKVAADKLRSEVQPTPEELQKYYEINKMAYQIPEKRNLGILVIDQAKLEQTIHPTDAELESLYNQNKDDYRTPERVNVRHILLKTTGDDPKQAAAVKAKAEELVKQLRAGANFADMVKKYSQDPGSVNKGGEYDGVVRGQMVPEFEKVAFSLKPGQISDPVKTTYGYHIIEVLAHFPAELKTFDQVKAALADKYRKQKVNDLIQQLSDKAQAALTKDPLHPQKVAADLGVDYFQANDVGTGDPLPGVGASKDFQDAIAGLKRAEVSQQVLVPGNKIAMAVCTGVIPAHPSAFADVQAKVRDAVVTSKANQLMDEKANQLLAKARADGGNLEAAAKSMGFEVKTTPPVDRAGAIEGLGSAGMLPDAFTEPVGSIFGPNGFSGSKVVGKVVERIPADMAGLAGERTAIRDEIKSQKGQTRNSLFEQGVRDMLTKEGKIKIHQEVVKRLITNYTS